MFDMFALSSSELHDLELVKLLLKENHVSITFIQTKYGLKRSKAQEIFKKYIEIIDQKKPFQCQTIFRNKSETIKKYLYNVKEYYDLKEGLLVNFDNIPYFIEEINDNGKGLVIVSLKDIKDI